MTQATVILVHGAALHAEVFAALGWRCCRRGRRSLS